MLCRKGIALLVEWLVVLIVTFATFTQSLVGFGFALVAMPLLSVAQVPPTISTPLVALLALSLRPLLVAHSWRFFRWRDIAPLTLSAALAVPVGIFFVQRLDQRLLVRVLGLLIVGYVLYETLLRARLQAEDLPWGKRWAVPLGLLAGLFGGAYNIFGPPAVVYGAGRHWPSRTFRANLQVFATMMSLLTSVAHFIDGNLTPQVISLALVCVPLALLSMALGLRLIRHLNERVYRKLVLGLLLLSGLRLLV
ncbi:MAG: sulfite exporter TauE/SafE family protein [Anaerolineae bacterium]|nr:sulfite exporter TauE/SafE family protein [Anaerolineae bacterium]MDW8172075.1 sulfite exporter TauE/SafE family protein [Anaerolineae bacterium]